MLLIAQLVFTSVDTGQFKVKVNSNILSDSTTVQVLPITITRVVADLAGYCHMFMFKDSSFVLRTFQKTDTTCVRKFELIPRSYRKISGYYQQRVDEICLLSERDSGCNYDSIFERFKSFSNGWPACSPYVDACGTLTTVMDYNTEQKDRYENGVCWLSSEQRYGIGDISNYNECYWSGWVYPYKPFPGRWETADNWLFFFRKSTM